MSGVRGWLAVVVGVGLGSWVGLAVAEDQAARSKARSSDAKLEQKLDAELQEDIRLNRNGVDAEVKKGVVWLTGVVDNDVDRARAEELVRAQGVTRIVNKIQVLDDPRPDPTAPQRVETDDRRALSDPQRKDPLVGTMPAEQTGSREIRMRTLGLPDPRKEQGGEQQPQPQPQPRQPEQPARPR